MKKKRIFESEILNFALKKISAPETIDRKKCIEEDRKRVQARLTGPRSETREMKQEKMRSYTDEWLKNVEQYEETNVSGFRRIYPPGKEEDAKRYKKFFNSSASLFQTTAAQRAREEAARIQLEELRMKNEIEMAKRQGRPIRDLNKFKKGESNIETGTGNVSVPTSKPIESRYKYNGNSNNNGLNGSPRKGANKPRRFKTNKEPIDIMLPVQILDSEENERKFQLRQRAAHIKSLGIVEIVHRTLNNRELNVSQNSQHKQSAPTGQGLGGMEKLVGPGRDICGVGKLFKR